MDSEHRKNLISELVETRGCGFVVWVLALRNGYLRSCHRFDLHKVNDVIVNAKDHS